MTRRGHKHAEAEQPHLQPLPCTVEVHSTRVPNRTTPPTPPHQDGWILDVDVDLDLDLAVKYLLR